MCSVIPFALLLLTTFSGGLALPTADGSPGEKATSGISSATNDEKEPIALTKYQQARFLFGTSTNTRFVTTTTSTIVTCVSSIDDGDNTAPDVVPCMKRRRRRSIKLRKAFNERLDSSLLELEDGDAQSGRLLFSAATVFTTLTFTQVVDDTIATKVSISLSCAPPGNINLCIAPAG